MLNRPNVLVCTDFSVYSDRAIKAGALLALKGGGKVIVAHIAEVGFYLEWGAYGVMPKSVHEDFVKIVQKDINKRIEDQLRRCEVEAEPFAQIAASIGEAVQAIVTEKKVDLLVMGERGNSVRSQFMLGGLVTKMAASSSVPVLVVKQDFKLGKIAGLVDPSESAHEIVSVSEELALLFASELEIISLWQDLPGIYNVHNPDNASALLNLLKKDTDMNLEKVREKINSELRGTEGTKIRVETSRERRIADHLAEVLSDGNFDLAVMKRHQKGILERFFIGSETARVLELFKGNILICPPTKDNK